MDTRLRRGITVGEYEVRPLEGRIIGPSGSQHVQPKVMEVLLCLAEYPGEIVERNTLIKHVWGGAAESGDALTRCISDLRHLFDDYHEAIRYIQTVPKRGYRLVAEVTDTTDASESPSVLAAIWADLNRRHVMRVGIAYIVVTWITLQVGETIFQALQFPPWALSLLLAFLAIGFPIAIIMAWVFQVTPEGVVVDIPGASLEPINVRRHLDIVIIGALVVAVTILGYREFAETRDMEVMRQPVITAGMSPLSSIAVLRFLDIGGEPHFADGLGEELIDRLAQINELGVAARTSSWAFSNADIDIPTIAARLAVDYVLEGSVRHAGDRIRVTAQLNDGITGKHIWSQTYDRELTSEAFFETQSEIAREVVGLLKITLSPESEARLSARPQTSMQALDYYLQGQEYFRKPHSDETLDQAAILFRRSLEIDPRFAMAYAGLCDTELGRYIIIRNVKVFEEAERACHRALTLNEDMPRVLAALGGLYLFSGQNEKAEEELRRAISGKSNLIDAYVDLGEALENQNRFDEAEETFLTAVARQPGYWYVHNALGNFLYRQSRYEEAADAFTRVTELVPDRALGHNNVAIAYYMLGNFEAASIAYERSVNIEPYADNYSNLGLSYFYEGRFDDAAELQRKALELRPGDARVIGRLATAYHYGGRENEAKKLFEEAIELIDEQLVVNPTDIRLNRFVAVYNVTIGNIDKGREAISRALDLQPESSGVHYDAAKVALAAGATDKALEYLQQAKEFGYSTQIISSDPVFRSLHGDARFVLIANK